MKIDLEHELAYFVKVRANCVDVKYCTTADSENGTAVAYKLNEEGRPFVDDRVLGSFAMQTLSGQAEIVLQDNAPEQAKIEYARIKKG